MAAQIIVQKMLTIILNRLFIYWKRNGQRLMYPMQFFTRIFQRTMGQIIASNIQQFYKDKDYVRVVGAGGMTSGINIPEQLGDMGTLRFDIVVADSEGMPAGPMEQFMLAAELYQMNLLTKGEFIEWVPMVNKDAILERLKSTGEDQMTIAGIPGPMGSAPQQ